MKATKEFNLEQLSVLCYQDIWDIVKYDPDTFVAFGAKPKPNPADGFLSNFNYNSLTVNGLHFLTSEHLYQALRFPDFPEIQQVIIDAKTPKDTKCIRALHMAKTMLDWERRERRVDAMAYTLAVKVAHYPGKFLNAVEPYTSRGQSIAEHSPWDSFWGGVIDEDGKYRGGNVLGKLLMEAADNFMAHKSNLTPGESYICTVDAPLQCFRLLGKPIEQVTASIVRKGTD